MLRRIAFRLPPEAPLAAAMSRPSVFRRLLTSPISQLATSLGYHVANATQVAMKTVPMMAAEFGDYTGAWKHVNDGYKFFAKMKGQNFDWSKIQDKGLREMLETASKRNLIDVGMAEDFDQYNTPRTGYETVDAGLLKGRKVLHKLRQASRWVERANRVTAASAAYNMAIKKGKSHDEAMDFGVKVLEQTQGDFSQLAAPLLIKNMPKFIVQYRKYQLMVAALYVKSFHDAFFGSSPAEKAIGRRMLGYMLLHTATVGGMMGLPLMNIAQLVVPAIASVLGDDDEPKDLERMMRDWFGDDNTTADMVLKGPLSTILGIDLGAKLSDDRVFSILPYTDIELSKKGFAEALVGLLGPGIAQARKMVDAWRRANSWSVPFWQGLEEAYTRAMRNKGHEFSAGRITYLFDGQHLWYALPSGRVLCYPFARLEPEGVTYAKASWKPAADAKEWPRARLWKGLACENVTQATAHDLLRHTLRRLEAEGHDVVLHVHDEVVVETNDPEAAQAAMQRIMCSPPAWAAGIPLNIEAAVMTRYGK